MKEVRCVVCCVWDFEKLGFGKGAMFLCEERETETPRKRRRAFLPFFFSI